AELVAAALLQRVVRGAVGHGEGRAILVAHVARHRQQVALVDDRLAGVAAMADHADHPVADLVAADACAQFGHVAADLVARGEGTRRLELVFVGDDQRVGEVDARGADGDTHLALAQRLGRQLHQLEALRPARRFAQHRAHDVGSIPLFRLSAALIRWRTGQRPSAPAGRPFAGRKMAGLYFEELTVDRVFDHAWTRTVTEMDNVLFTWLTMNVQPLHLDEEFASKTEFGQRIVNSLFTLGLMIGITVNDTTLGTTVANLGMTDVKFPRPVFHGDTLRVQTK